MKAYRGGLLEELARLCGRPSEELTREAQQDSDARHRDRRDSESSARSVAGQRSRKPLRAAARWRPGKRSLPTRRVGCFRAIWGRPAARIVVAEELDYHVLVSDLSLEVISEVEAHPEKYPAYASSSRYRANIPAGSLAANVVGHLGIADKTSDRADQRTADDRLLPVGLLGIERQCEDQLRGHSGELVDLTDHGGHWKSSHRRREPTSGRELALTLDARAFSGLPRSNSTAHWFASVESRQAPTTQRAQSWFSMFAPALSWPPRPARASIPAYSLATTRPQLRTCCAIPLIRSSIARCEWRFRPARCSSS